MSRLAARVPDYLDLTKPRVILLVLVVTGTGYYLGLRGALDLPVLLACLAGTACLAAGASALNQFLERGLDALMIRTGERPLPAGRLFPMEALIFGLVLGAAGVLLLTAGPGLFTGMLGFLSFVAYVGLYTPLKRRTSWALHVGAVPGALPPLIGWSAASGSLAAESWAVFAILFVWQIPHFAAIAWMYREDYRAAGFPMLAVRDDRGGATARQMVSNTLLLIVVSLLPVWMGFAGYAYLAGAVLLGLLFLGAAIHFTRLKSHARARRVLQASLLYLPALFLLLTFSGL